MAVQVMSSEQARTQWRTLLDLAGQGDVDVIIERHGKATATVISYELYQAMQGAMAELRGGDDRGKNMANALQAISALPERTLIDDPVQWQIEQRSDRTLIDREN